MVCLFKTQRGARAEKHPLKQGMVIESGCELRDCNRMQFMRSRCRFMGPFGTHPDRMFGVTTRLDVRWVKAVE